MKLVYQGGGINRAQPVADQWIGVDLNTTGHIAVVAHPLTGHVLKIGKKSDFIDKSFLKHRHELEKERRYKELKKLRNRERSIIKNLNHTVSKEIVSVAKYFDCGIKLERFYGPQRQRKKNFSIDHVTFQELQKMVETKARKVGIPVQFINPSFTSQRCSRCGKLGVRHRKKFECPHCGYFDHADVNAAFNIAATGTELSLHPAPGSTFVIPE